MLKKRQFPKFWANNQEVTEDKDRIPTSELQENQTKMEEVYFGYFTYILDTLHSGY